MEKFPCPHCSPYPSLTECHYNIPDEPGFLKTTDFVAVTRHGIARVAWASKIRVESEFVDPKATTCPGCNKALTEEEVTNPRLNHALEILLKGEEVALREAEEAQPKQEVGARRRKLYEESRQRDNFHVQLVGVPEKKWHPDALDDPIWAMLSYRHMYHNCGMGHITCICQLHYKYVFFGPTVYPRYISFECTGCQRRVTMSTEGLTSTLRRLFTKLDPVDVVGETSSSRNIIVFSFIEKAPY